MIYIILAVLLVLLVIWIKISLSYWERRGVPGPKPWPIIGNIGEHLIGKKTLGEVMRDIYKYNVVMSNEGTGHVKDTPGAGRPKTSTHEEKALDILGSITENPHLSTRTLGQGTNREYEGYPFVGLFRATKPVLLLRDPELVTQVLVKDFKSFRNNEFHVSKDVDPLFGRNPFVLRDQEWKDTRQMLTPGMTSGKIKNMFALLQEISGNLVKFIENHPTAATEGIEARSLTKRLTLDNVAKTAFGVDGKAFESYDDISEFNKLVNNFLTPGSAFSLYFGIVQIFPAMASLLHFKLVPHDVEIKLTEIISEVVKYRRENNLKGSDYLQFLIELAKAKNFDDQEITSHASTFFIDGYETSSLVMSFLLLNLARNPKYQEKIREDIRKYEKENNGELTYEAILEMPWLNACFYESLRATPPVEVLAKLCTENFEYTPTNPDFKKVSVKLTPGDVILIPYGLLGTDKKHFEDADQFIPERMLDKDSYNKSCFFPFSDGPRACIGRRVGIMQIKLGVANILKHFKLTVSPKFKEPIKYLPYHPFNEVKGGIWVKFEKINN